MSNDKPVDLGHLAELEVPDVVGPAAARFRRRLLGVGAAVAAVALLAGFGIAHQPADTTPRGLMATADVRHGINEVLRDGDVSLTVLGAARISDGVYMLHVVGAGDGLDETEALELSVPLNSLLPPPGQEPPDLPGHQMQTLGVGPDQDGYGPGRHVVQAWIVLPTGTPTVPVIFAAGVPADPGDFRPLPPGPDEPRAEEQVEMLTPMPDAPMLPPTAPGTARTLGTLTIELDALGVPANVWR